MPIIVVTHMTLWATAKRENTGVRSREDKAQCIHQNHTYNWWNRFACSTLLKLSSPRRDCVIIGENVIPY